MAKLSTRPNRFYPSIPGITNDPSTYLNALIQIRESIETHERRNANYLKSFVRFEELVDLGIIDEEGNFILELGTGDGDGGGTGVTLLGELDDVTITAVNDNEFLVWDAATSQWTNQNATEAGIPTVDEIANILDDLDDIDLTGGQIYDMLWKNAATPSLWVPTAGAMQFDGTRLHVPSGVNFFPVGGSGAYLRTGVSAGFSLDVFAQGGLFVNSTDLILDENLAIDWRINGSSRVELLTFIPSFGGAGTPVSDPNLGEVTYLITGTGAPTGIQQDFEMDIGGTADYNLVNNGGTLSQVYETGGEYDNGRCLRMDTWNGSALNTGGHRIGNFSTDAGLQFGSDSFTIEFSIAVDGTYAGQEVGTIISGNSGDVVAGQRAWEVQIDSVNRLNFRMSQDGTTFNTVVAQQVLFGSEANGDGSFGSGTYQKIAIVRDASGTPEVRVYVNGTLTYTNASGAQISIFNGNTDAYLCTSNSQSASNRKPGRLDNIRITKGVARYSGASYTPATAPFDGSSALGQSFIVGDPLYGTLIDGDIITLEAVTQINIPDDIGVNWRLTDGSSVENIHFFAGVPGDQFFDERVLYVENFHSNAVGDNYADQSIYGHTCTPQNSANDVEIEVGPGKFGPNVFANQVGGSNANGVLLSGGTNPNNPSETFSSRWTFGTRSFCIETWVNVTDKSTFTDLNCDVGIFDYWAGTLDGCAFGFDVNGAANWNVHVAYDGSITTSTAVGDVFDENVWHHVAIIHDESTRTLYYFVDGTSVYSVSVAGRTLGAPSSNLIRPMSENISGADHGNQVKYDSFRVTVDTTRYDVTGFTPPTEAFPTNQLGTGVFTLGDPARQTFIDGTVISLEAATRIDIPNNIGVNWDNEAGSAVEHLIFTRPATETLTTAYDGSAGGSLGAGTISFANGAVIDSDLVTMADKDWSLEVWGYYVSDSSDQTFAALDLSFSGNRVFEWYWDFSTSEYVFSYSTDGDAETFFRFAGTPPSAWAHYHLRRDGANIQMYVNGVQQGGVGNIGTDVIYDIRETNPVFNTPRLFQSDDLTGVWRGFAQEFRWTMGANRGTTAPTVAFPRGPENDPLWGNVICLFSFDGTVGADANTTVDEGPNGLGLFSSNNTLEVPGVGLQFDTKRIPSETYFVGDPGYPTVIDGDSVTITTSLEVQGTANVTGSAFVADDFFVARDSNLSGDVRVGGSLNVIQGAVFDGTVTVTDDLTRLQGDAYVTDELRVYDAGGTDYISDTHDGTDATRTFFQTTNYNINGVTEVVIQDAVSVDVDALNVLDSKSIDFFSAATFLQVPTLKTAIEPGGDVYYNDVDFLMLAEGADEDTSYTSDDAGARTATFVANAKLDDAVTPKYNATTTLLLDGANSYVTFPDSADWVLGTDDFTMEAWVQSAANNPSGTILSQWNSATNDNRAFQFRLNGGFGWISFDYRDTSGNQVTLNGTGFQGTWGANTWYHICIQRDTANDALYYYRDGVRGGTLTLDGTRSIRDSASPLAVGIGDQNFLSGDYVGNLEGIRFTRGRLRYPAAGFTPPTAAMETQQADILFEVGDDAGVLPTDIYGKDINLLADTYIRNNAPRLVFWDEDATADEQVWLLSNIGDEFKLETAADATPTTGVESALTIARTGTAIDTMTFANGEAIFSDTLRVPVYDDAGRPAAGTAGRVIFNTTDGQLNIDDGTNWTLPDGTTT